MTLQHFNATQCNPYPILNRLIYEARADMTPFELASLLAKLDRNAIETAHPGILREIWLLVD